MSTAIPFPGNAEKDQEKVCPFLGLWEDSQTSLSYPSSWNVCHHSKPVGTPSLDFQQSYCFSENHINCPVYTRSSRAPLPSGIRIQPTSTPLQNRILFSILIGGVLVILGVLGTLWAIQDSKNHGGNLAGVTESATPTDTQLPSPTDTAIPFTDTPVPATMTDTPMPSSTNTPAGPVTPPTDTLWPSLTLTPSATYLPTATPTLAPPATATFLPTSTPRPADTQWPSLTFTPHE